MSLANRLSSAVPFRANRGCVTCMWLDELPDADRQAFDDWIRSGNSVAQLWEIASTMEDNPLQVSNTGLRHHIKHHKARRES